MNVKVKRIKCVKCHKYFSQGKYITREQEYFIECPHCKTLYWAKILIEKRKGR